jgi:hypothetical protein
VKVEDGGGERWFRLREFPITSMAAAVVSKCVKFGALFIHKCVMAGTNGFLGGKSLVYGWVALGTLNFYIFLIK